MRHLITPMNLSVEETMNILDLAEQMGKRLPLFFTNQVPEPVYLSSLLC